MENVSEPSATAPADELATDQVGTSNLDAGATSSALETTLRSIMPLVPWLSHRNDLLPTTNRDQSISASKPPIDTFVKSESTAGSSHVHGADRSHVVRAAPANTTVEQQPTVTDATNTMTVQEEETRVHAAITTFLPPPTAGERLFHATQYKRLQTRASLAQSLARGDCFHCVLLVETDTMNDYGAGLSSSRATCEKSSTSDGEDSPTGNTEESDASPAYLHSLIPFHCYRSVASSSLLPQATAGDCDLAKAVSVIDQAMLKSAVALLGLEAVPATTARAPTAAADRLRTDTSWPHFQRRDVDKADADMEIFTLPPPPEASAWAYCQTQWLRPTDASSDISSGAAVDAGGGASEGGRRDVLADAVAAPRVTRICMLINFDTGAAEGEPSAIGAAAANRARAPPIPYKSLHKVSVALTRARARAVTVCAARAIVAAKARLPGVLSRRERRSVYQH